MRVFEIGMHWFPEGGGGADRYFYGLVSELTHHDCALKAFVFGEGKSDPGSHVRFLGKRNQSLRERLLKLRKGVKEELARESRPALIASHFSLYVFPLLDFFWRHPHVVHFHGPWADESAAEGESSRAVYFKQTIERVTYATARRFIVLSKAFRDVLVTRYRIREDRIDIVPGGVQADAFKTGLSRAEARERLGWPKDRIILLTVRRLARRMGLENFIEAIGQLREKEPAILACVGGNWSAGWRAGCSRRAEELARTCQTGGVRSRCRLASGLSSSRCQRSSVDRSRRIRLDRPRVARRRDAGDRNAGGRTPRGGQRALERSDPRRLLASSDRRWLGSTPRRLGKTAFGECLPGVRQGQL